MLSTIRNFLRSLDRSPLAWPIAIAGALIFALMLPAAMGLTYGDHTLREFWDWKNILFVILTLFTLSQWKISRWFIAIPLVLIFGCYLPAGILYGKPSILVAIALMQTTPAETQEFLMNTPWQLFAEAIGFIFAGLAAIHFFGQVKIPRKTGFVTGLAACAIAWFVSYGSGKTYDQIQTASFFHSFGTTMWYSAEELREEANALPPSWKVTSAEPQYKTYVVIIGESQRRDYASVYGYPLDTRGVIQHEAGGHGFGKLGDEYIYHNAFIDFCGCSCCGHVLEFNAAKSLGWYDNLELTGKMHSVGWSHLIFDDRYSDIVDIYEGGYMHNRGVFRSEPNSCMNNDIPYYSTISRESIVKRSKAYAGETNSSADFVKNDKRDAGIVESRAFGGNGDQRTSGTYQHAPVFHKGSPLKMAKVRKHR